MISNKGSKGKLKRLLAVLMSFIMILSMMSSSMGFSVDAITVSEYSFTIIDGSDPVADATISIYGPTAITTTATTTTATVTTATVTTATVTTATTDANGKAIFTDIETDYQYTYEITKFGYKTESGVINFPSNPTNTNINLSALARITVVGNVTDGINPIEGAILQMNGYSTYTSSTNSTGDYSIEDVYEGQVYSITISKNGFKTMTVPVVDLLKSNDFVLVKKEEQSDFKFNNSGPIDIIYNPTNLTFTNIALGGNILATTLYSSTNESVATVDSAGTITISSVGSTTIMATKAGDEEYADASISYVLTVQKADQIVTFEKEMNNTITYYDKLIYSNRASSNKTTNKITYSITDGDDLADIDISTGDLSINYAGTVVITASIEGDEYYNSSSASYTLIVEKADDLGFGFDVANPPNILYGNNFSNKASGGKGTGSISYTIQSGTNATINNATGQLTITGTGNLVVRANKAGDRRNKPATATYTLKVVYLNPPTQAYILSGQHTNSNWFTDNVTIQAPAGYQISTSNSLAPTNVWMDKVIDIATVDGKQNIDVFLKNSQGISDRINVSIWKDETNPTAGIRVGTLGFWDKLLSSLTFGLYTKSKVPVTIESSDGTSGVATEQYFTTKDATKLTKSDLDNLELSKWKIYSPFNIATDNKIVIYAKVTDQAGNYTYVSTDGIIFDSTAATVLFTEDIITPHGVYNSDATIKIEVTDSAPSSGIKEIAYRVENNGVVTQESVLYTYAGTSTDQKDLLFNWNGMITVEAALNNSNDVILYVETKDNIGNESTSTFSLKIDTTKPNVTITFDDTIVTNIDGNRGYYNAPRTATIVITERTANFDPAIATDAISIIAKSLSNVPIVFPSSKISTWVTVEGATPDEAKHEATIHYDCSANYTVGISYYDKATNSSTDVSYVDSEFPEEFTIDTDAPMGTISISDTIWNELIESLTFGLWSNKSVTISGTTWDATSPIKSVEYYKTDSTTALVRAQLDAIDSSLWKPFNTFTLNQNEQFVVYMKITDFVDNYTYISSNGYIVDMTVSDISITPVAANAHGFYNDDVEVAISVIDPEPYSGIKEIKYRVENNGVITQQDSLFHFTNTNPTHNQLQSIWTGTIIVDATINNSDDVIVYVMVKDNAGNEFYSQKSLKINSSIPKVYISYEDSGGSLINSGYFDQSRTATIVITDRTSSFDGNSASSGISIKAVDANGTIIVLPVISRVWTTLEGATPDEAKHSTTITYDIDANYTFDFSYTNNAGNSNESIDYQSSETPTSFTVDTTNPSGAITVSSDVWNNLLNVLTFGIWKNTSLNIAITASDITSPVSIQYYKSSDSFIKTATQLDAISNNAWVDFAPFSIDSDEQFVIYARISDYAGNYSYICSDGYIVDKTPSNITLTPSSANSSGVYSSNVTIGVTVTDPAPYSGIKEISYNVVSKGSTTQSSTLFSFSKTAPLQSELLSNWSGTVTVDSAKNNSDNVMVEVTVKDNAGNQYSKNITLNIDTTSPSINVNFADSGVKKIVDGHGYFDNNRTATIVITERTSNFDASSVSGINNISGWSTVEGASPDSATHTATVNFNTDAKYTFGISCTDRAGNSSGSVNYGNSVTPTLFTVDKTKPIGSITVDKFGVWEDLIKTLTFGLWSKEDVEITVKASDITSQIDTVLYYKTSNTKLLTADDLDKLAVADWVKYEPLFIKPNELFVIYVRITDNSGNYIYISSNGIILDNAAPMTESIVPEITLTPQQPINDIYNTDVKVAITVIDPIVNSTYSGIRKITYEVTNMGLVTQSGTLYSFETISSPTKEQLKQKWEGSITVDKRLNNSNDVILKVSTEDNSGMVSTKTKAIKVDITAPKITVSYNNNVADSSFTESTYFKDNRTATIAITERNFMERDVRIDITNSDGIIPTISTWKKIAGTGNGDDTVHMATITYSSDGDYLFHISYDDLAKNKNEVINYGSSLAPLKFTIDKTVPVIDITYDNNNVQNNNYYNATRTATIKIKEHNFETGRIVMSVTASDNGVTTATPKLSNWNSNGDIHSATITFEEDALYNFDFAYSDKAKNEATKVDKQTFYIDKTQPNLSIAGVIDESANNKDTIGFVIEAQDVNFDTFVPVLTLANLNGSEIVTQLLGEAQKIANGQKYIIENLASDGIYTLTCSVIDKAGNVSENVTLVDDTNNPYEKIYSNSNSLLTFSINRNGSTFELKDETQQIINQYYLQNIEDNIEVFEINVDPLLEYKVELNKVTLTQGKDYTVKEVSSNSGGGWSKYAYSINSSLFSEEGEYSLVITTTDKTGTTAYSDIKSNEISFLIDRTAPEVTISGLMSSGRYNTESQAVTIVAKDPGAKLYSLLVVLNGTKTVLDYSGNEFNEVLASDSDKVTFAMPSGMGQTAQITCVDMAGNTFTKNLENITVSNEWYVLFYSNKPLFYGAIGGVSAIIIAIAAFFILKKKPIKKN